MLYLLFGLIFLGVIFTLFLNPIVSFVDNIFARLTNREKTIVDFSKFTVSDYNDAYDFICAKFAICNEGKISKDILSLCDFPIELHDFFEKYTTLIYDQATGPDDINSEDLTIVVINDQRYVRIFDEGDAEFIVPLISKDKCPVYILTGNPDILEFFVANDTLLTFLNTPVKIADSSVQYIVESKLEAIPNLYNTFLAYRTQKNK